MADITAKRGPRDPSEGLTNQGVATQAMLNSMAREQQYELQKRAKKKSTWDKIVGGVKDVVDIGKGVMDIANSYEDLQVKDEQIQCSELMRQQQELSLEASKQRMGVQSIQNDLQLKQLQKDNSFLDTFNTYVQDNDFDGAVRTALENPRQAKAYKELLTYTADQLEKNGDTDRADALRLVASPDNTLKQLTSKYVKDSESGKAANLPKIVEYNNYKSKVDALAKEILTDDNNIATIKDLLGGESRDVAKDLMTCAINMEASNTVNKNLDGKEYSNSMSLNPDSNLSKPTTDSSGKNIQYLDVTCKVGDDFGNGKIVYDASRPISYPVYNNRGVYVGMEETTVGKAVADLIAHNKNYLKLIGKDKEYEAVISTDKVMQEQAAIRSSKIESSNPPNNSTPKVESESEQIVSDVKVKESGGKIKIGKKTKAEIKKEEKLNSDQLALQIIKEIRAIQNDKDTREKFLQKIGFTEQQYQSLPPAKKYLFLMDLNKAVRSALKTSDTVDVEKIKTEVKAKYNL